MGAYRHGRFIAWDDDVDITVPIKHQAILLGAVKEDAAKLGISVMRSYINTTLRYYQEVGAYLHTVAPNVTDTSPGDNHSGTLGYFCQAWYQGLKIDIWQAFPVVLDGKVLYSTGGGDTVFSRTDVFPLKRCSFEGRSYLCPQRSQRYLSRMYVDLSSPEDWRQWWNNASCDWDRFAISQTKFKFQDAHPSASARIVLDNTTMREETVRLVMPQTAAKTGVHLEVPPGVTPDPVDGYNDLELGYFPGIIPPQ